MFVVSCCHTSECTHFGPSQTARAEQALCLALALVAVAQSPAQLPATSRSQFADADSCRALLGEGRGCHLWGQIFLRVAAPIVDSTSAMLMPMRTPFSCGDAHAASSAAQVAITMSLNERIDVRSLERCLSEIFQGAKTMPRGAPAGG